MNIKASLKTFVKCEALGLALVWVAYLLPREPRPVIPTIVMVIGLLVCSTGCAFLPSPRRVPSMDGKGDRSSAQWMAGDGASHGDCGGHGGDGAGWGDGGGH